MAQIEQSPIARLALITLHDIGLNLYSTIYNLAQALRVTLQCRKIRLLQHLKQSCIANHSRLDYLGKTRAELPRGERAQQIHITDNKPRLGERTHHILISIDIHSILAPHAGIHLPQQRRGDKTKLHSTHKRRGGKARNIGHNASAHSQHEARAVNAQLNKAAIYHIQRTQRLARLAKSDEHVVVRLDERVVVAVDIGIRHHNNTLLGEQPRQPLTHATHYYSAAVLDIYIEIHNISTLNSRTKIAHFNEFY